MADYYLLDLIICGSIATNLLIKSGLLKGTAHSEIRMYQKQHNVHLLRGSLACWHFSMINQTQNLWIGNDWTNAHFSLCVCSMFSFQCIIPNRTMGTETLKIPRGIFKQWGRVIYWVINWYSVLTEFFHPHIPVRYPDIFAPLSQKRFVVTGLKALIACSFPSQLLCFEN